jgi:hypothetical protein
MQNEIVSIQNRSLLLRRVSNENLQKGGRFSPHVSLYTCRPIIRKSPEECSLNLVLTSFTKWFWYIPILVKISFVRKFVELSQVS